MKHFYFLFSIALLVSNFSFGQTTIYTQDFETTPATQNEIDTLYVCGGQEIAFNNLKDTWYSKWLEQSKRLISLKDKVWSLEIIYSLADQTGLTWNEKSLNKKYFDKSITKEPNWLENLSLKQIALIEKLEK